VIDSEGAASLSVPDRATIGNMAPEYGATIPLDEQSSRDWAAKGTRLLGIRAVIARGFERIHRSRPRTSRRAESSRMSSSSCSRKAHFRSA